MWFWDTKKPAGPFRSLPALVGLAGFEPTDAGVKVPCLTAWRQPIIEKSELFRVRFPCNVGWLVGLEPTASRATIWRASQLRHSHHITGAPGGTRTPGPLLRRQLLYPPELRAPESSGLCETLLEYHTMARDKSQGLPQTFCAPHWHIAGIYAILLKMISRGPTPLLDAPGRKGSLNECPTSGMT